MWDLINQALQQSTNRVIARTADFLPGVLAMIVALVLAIIIGGALRWIVRRSLASVQFDERLDQWGSRRSANGRRRAAPRYWSREACSGDYCGRPAHWRLGAGCPHHPDIRRASLRLRAQCDCRGFSDSGGELPSRFLARAVLVSAVDMRLHSARLISLGVKWLILVLSTAMALDHLRIGGDILKLAFGIIFGGIVLAMALAVGLGSKDIVSRSWERQEEEGATSVEEPFHHL